MKVHPDLNIKVTEDGSIYTTIKRKTHVTKNGYERLNVVVERGKKKFFFVHRLVAETYIPNPNNLPYVHHIDHNKLNNHVSNLMWVTPKQNIKYAEEYMGQWRNPQDIQYKYHRMSKI